MLASNGNMNKEIAEQLAQWCLDAMSTHQQSYDHAAADKATEIDNARRERDKLNPNSLDMCLVDYSKFYKYDLQEACMKVSPECGFLIYLALDAWWNDVQDWANQTLGLLPSEFGLAEQHLKDSDDPCLKGPF